LHANYQGSVIAVSNNAGTSIATNSYDAYGIPATTNLGRFAYTGQIRVPEIGMYYYKARIYSPTLGRFLQTDPIGYKDDIDLYTYVGNDPVNKTDPTGMICVFGFCNTCPSGNSTPTAATAVTAVAAREGIGADRARSQYKATTAKLAPNDSAGRSAAKASARAATPPITRRVIEAVRPGLGPKPGSGGTANSTNVGADKLAGRLGTAGRIAGVAGIAVGVARVVTSDNPGQEAVRVGGGLAGALAGAEGGAALGTPGGPYGIAAGGIIGGLAGGYLGEEAINEILD
jgi:RHS repeat-associated protein